VKEGECLLPRPQIKCWFIGETTKAFGVKISKCHRNAFLMFHTSGAAQHLHVQTTPLEMPAVRKTRAESFSMEPIRYKIRPWPFTGMVSNATSHPIMKDVCIFILIYTFAERKNFEVLLKFYRLCCMKYTFFSLTDGFLYCPKPLTL